jgi:hypothetical protein
MKYSVQEAAKVIGTHHKLAYQHLVRWRKKTGNEACHHPEKKEQIAHCLRHRKDLQILEFNGFKGNGDAGECTKAYTEFGEVFQCVRQTNPSVKTDMTRLCAELALLAAGGVPRYDVIDIDRYGDPSELLVTGALRILKSKGLAFISWPSKQAYRFPQMSQLSKAQYGVPMPDTNHLVDYVINKIAPLHGLTCTVENIMGVGPEKAPFRRICFKVTRPVYLLNLKQPELLEESKEEQVA